MEDLNGLQVGILVTGFALSGLGSYIAVGFVTRWSLKWIPLGLGAAILNGFIYVVTVKEILEL